MQAPVFELTQEHILDLAQSCNHSGKLPMLALSALVGWSCRKPYYRESLSPFDEKDVQKLPG
jgi:hypothetical protein